MVRLLKYLILFNHVSMLKYYYNPLYRKKKLENPNNSE